MKSKKELNELRSEVEAEPKNPRKLTDEELAQVTGGAYNKDLYDQGTYDLYYPGKYDEYNTQSH